MMMNPTELNNLVLRATALLKTNWLHAAHILETAVIDNPDNPVLLQNLGDIYLKRQLYEKALVCYQDALANKPADTYLLFIIGNCYFAMGDYRLANSYFNQIPDPPPEVLYNKALCLSFLGNTQDSIKVILRILNLMSDNPFIYFLLIEQYLRLENYDEALSVINTAELKFGKHIQLLLFSALIHTKKGIWLKAYHAFQQCDKLFPITNSEHLLNYAVAAKKIGMEASAVDILLRAREHDPYISSIHEELIRLQLQTGDWLGAKKSLTIAKKYILRLTPVLKLLQERIHTEDT